MAAASFSGNHFLLLLLFVSLFSSSHVVEGSTRQSFNKFSRSSLTSNHPTEVTYQKSSAQEEQPDFYPENEYQHGLTEKGSPLSPPPPPQTYPTPPPPSYRNPSAGEPKWLPKNYDKNYYVTNENEVSPYMYQEEIIEDEKNDKTTSTTQSNPQFEEEEEFDPNDLEDEPSPTSTDEQPKYEGRTSEKTYSYSNSHALEDTEKEREQQTYDENTNQPPPPQKKNNQQKQGMSDTRYLANGMYAYNVETNSFSENHPYKQINSRTTAYTKANYRQNYYDPTGKTNAYTNQNYGRQSYGEESNGEP